ncbi:MAG: DUF4893 domain-containing protein [Sphingomonadaceae bacterium]
MKAFPFAALPLLLAACAQGVDVSSRVAAAPASAWRDVATVDDRDRLHGWRDAWLEALGQARAAGHAADIAKWGTLAEPDAAIEGGVPPPAGRYRCRTIKLGARREGLLNYVDYPPFECVIEGEGAALRFVKQSGSQRPVGVLYPDSERRMIFLGTLALGDERRALRYGTDRERDMIGILEQVDAARWRLVLPYPHFESTLDILELVPRE